MDEGGLPQVKHEERNEMACAHEITWVDWIGFDDEKRKIMG